MLTWYLSLWVIVGKWTFPGMKTMEWLKYPQRIASLFYSSPPPSNSAWPAIASLTAAFTGIAQIWTTGWKYDLLHTSELVLQSRKLITGFLFVIKGWRNVTIWELVLGPHLLNQREIKILQFYKYFSVSHHLWTVAAIIKCLWLLLQLHIRPENCISW